MSYLVHITDTQTGEQRVRTMDLDWIDGSAYWWSDGNFGCDCNRADVFEDNANECVERPCGHGRYVVRCVTHDGATLYEDDR